MAEEKGEESMNTGKYSTRLMKRSRTNVEILGEWSWASAKWGHIS